MLGHDIIVPVFAIVRITVCTGTTMSFGGQCFGCHSAARAFDFICETGRGCIVFPIGGEVIARLQDSDPRCQR